MTQSISPTIIRVGVVDDQLIFIAGCMKVLNDIDGVESTLEAYSGKELLDLLKIVPELPDILLMDVNMKNMNGIEATEKVTRLYPSIKVIALTINDDDWTMSQMMIAGACAYLRKDIHPKKMKEILQEVHTKGKYYADLFHLYGEGLRMYKEELAKIRFTEKEKQYLKLLCKGYNYTQIAYTMCLSIRTMDYYWSCISKKLNTDKQPLVILMALRMGIVKLNEEKQWSNQ